MFDECERLVSVLCYYCSYFTDSLSCRKKKVKHANSGIFFVRGFFFLADRKKILTRIIPIDLFSLYVLLSQYRSCDNTVEKIFFSNFVLLTCISTHNLWKDKGSRSPRLGPLLRRQNVQVKEVYSFPLHGLVLRACLHGSGGPQLGEVTRLGGVIRLSI